MTPDQIAALRPQAETVAAITAALDKIDAAKREASDCLDAAEAERARYVTEGATEKQRAALDAARASAVFDLDQLAALERDLSPRLESAVQREAEAARQREIDALVAEIDANTARWDAELPALSAAISDMVDERRRLAARARAAGLVKLAGEVEHGTTWTPATTAAMRAEMAAAEARNRAEAARAEAERRERQRAEWRRQDEEYAARQAAAEADARARGLVELPSPVRITYR
ncbi:hypothetical protein [Acidiphilium sp.]|uniref:hypothetical protein n=1 Tax=Acidiphilium sp. TaxID=527 RepID=UPI00258F7715|nr:hypothetical protein [Acidiphilium sp.]